MANTRETLGDQATLDGLVANTLTSLEENGVTTIAKSLYGRTALTSVKFPNLTSTGTGTFENCTGLETVDLCEGGPACTIGASAFSGDTNLKHLIIRSNTMSTLSNTNAFTSTKIGNWRGAVYVPSSLISTYKSNTNWKKYIIVSVDDYPMSDEQIKEEFDSTFTDTDAVTWREIINNDNYGTDYELGKLVPLTINGTQHYMELVAKDADDKADGSGKARMTWIVKDLIGLHGMNTSNTNYNGWPSSAMRSWLNNTILPTISPVIQRYIVSVTKSSYNYTFGTTVFTTDTIWIPSIREIVGVTDFESTGVIYNEIFKDGTSRIKEYNGNSNIWWLRSAEKRGQYNFIYINSSGTYNFTSSNREYGVAIGFCL